MVCRCALDGASSDCPAHQLLNFWQVSDNLTPSTWNFSKTLSVIDPDQKDWLSSARITAAERELPFSVPEHRSVIALGLLSGSTSNSDWPQRMRRTMRSTQADPVHSIPTESQKLSHHFAPRTGRQEQSTNSQRIVARLRRESRRPSSHR